jgi:hypothetical protein
VTASRTGDPPPLVALQQRVDGRLGAHALTRPRVAGALLCLGAVAPASLGRDARVLRTTGDVGVTTPPSIAAGTSALPAGVAVATAVHGTPDADWPGPAEWNLHLGGPLGTAVRRR